MIFDALAFATVSKPVRMTAIPHHHFAPPSTAAIWLSL